MDGIVAVTYRCNSRCVMCYIWEHQSKQAEEITARDLNNLPEMVRLNITGGEPFLREDIGSILEVVKGKAKRVVISSNGFLTKKTLDVMKDHRDIGIRISLDGIGATHNTIRGVDFAFDRAVATLKGLIELGVKDIGIAATISDTNAGELISLYEFARRNHVELATAILHNAYYFQKQDNRIEDKKRVETEIRNLMREYLKSSHPKDWFRAYFSQGIIKHMHGQPREMKCTMATDSFFVDPYGFVRPCNVMDLPFGNIKEKPFSEIWHSSEAEAARKKVDACRENCWMIGSVGHLIRHKPWAPLWWICQNKLGSRG